MAITLYITSYEIVFAKYAELGLNFFIVLVCYYIVSHDLSIPREILTAIVASALWERGFQHHLSERYRNPDIQQLQREGHRVLSYQAHRAKIQLGCKHPHSQKQMRQGRFAS